MTIINAAGILRPSTAAERSEAQKVWDETLTAYHGSHHSVRDALAYERMLADDRARALALIERLEGDWQREDDETFRWQTEKLARMRHHQRLASPLFLAFCTHEGLDPVTMADAILARGLKLMPGDGHPWLPTGSDEHDAAVRHHPRYEWAGRDHAARIRRRDDLRGFAEVVQNGYTVDLQADIGRAKVATHQGKGTISFADHIPETVLTASIGRRVEEMIDHPVLAGDLKITAVEGHTVDRAATLISFDCPGVPFRADAAPAPQGTPTLFCDPTLEGAAALSDVLTRMTATIRVGGKLPTPHVLLRDARVRTRWINTARPRRTPLPDPTQEDVLRAIGRR